MMQSRTQGHDPGLKTQPSSLPAKMLTPQQFIEVRPLLIRDGQSDSERRACAESLCISVCILRLAVLTRPSVESTDDPGPQLWVRPLARVVSCCRMQSGSGDEGPVSYLTLWGHSPWRSAAACGAACARAGPSRS